MQARSFFFLALLSLSSACGACGADPAKPAPAPTPEHEKNPNEADPREPAPQVALFVTAEHGLRIESRGPDRASLAPRVSVERQSGDRWSEVAFLSVRASCEERPPSGCVSLVPGAELLPAAWTGQLGAGQCACEDCQPAEPGTYRFVVRSCKGTHRLPTAPFTR